MNIVIQGCDGHMITALTGELRSRGAEILESLPESGPVVLVSLSEDKASSALDQMSPADFRAYLDKALDQPWRALRTGLGHLKGRADAAIVHVVIEGPRAPGNPSLPQAIEIMVRSAVLECGAAPRINLVRSSASASVRELAETILYLGAPAARFVTGMTVSIGDAA